MFKDAVITNPVVAQSQSRTRLPLAAGGFAAAGRSLLKTQRCTEQVAE